MKPNGSDKLMVCESFEELVQNLKHTLSSFNWGKIKAVLDVISERLLAVNKSNKKQFARDYFSVVNNALFAYCVENRINARFGFYVDEIYETLITPGTNPEELIRFLYRIAISIIDKRTDDEIKELLKNKADSDDITSPRNTSEKITSSKNISKIKAHIRNNISSDLSLKNLSTILCYNESYLSRFFKRHNGYTISEYIEFMRLEKAKEQLINTNEPINMIGQQIGFESPRYFTYFLKKLLGMTPREYRRTHKQKYSDLL